MSSPFRYVLSIQSNKYGGGTTFWSQHADWEEALAEARECAGEPFDFMALADRETGEIVNVVVDGKPVGYAA
jgi:hypothetical protein